MQTVIGVEFDPATLGQVRRREREDQHLREYRGFETQ